ncbi:hypothetical protein K443DRAFT_681705 [Laccaria amethystina LaAM-08-1]|uniref:Uncharacterized protein n=1 Tax=Laccaria amethystina LaAM-08-1 TaxID=1095629 RepID=A0A0C9WLG3_9AGAR|nr:hypothetical protein K443DRAFT_681705 [Laccaria amethystina LaAM-08-1]
MVVYDITKHHIRPLHDGYGNGTPQRLNLVYCKHSSGLLKDGLEHTIVPNFELVDQ